MAASVTAVRVRGSGRRRVFRVVVGVRASRTDRAAVEHRGSGNRHGDPGAFEEFESVSENFSLNREQRSEL